LSVALCVQRRPPISDRAVHPGITHQIDAVITLHVRVVYRTTRLKELFGEFPPILKIKTGKNDKEFDGE
jgi:hypothetical protein